jgi:uncharacterized membrane-anchored protein YitT (DUF2179 family)
MLAAFGTSEFLLPNQLSSGGFSGIATITYYLFNIPMGTTIMVLNIPLFILGYIKLGKKFILKTIIATFLYSGFIDMFSGLNIFTQDRLLSSIYGGIFIGIGLALVFKANASTGGTDLIAHIAQNYNVNMRMSNIIVIIDFIVVLSNLIAFKEVEIGLYSVIAIYVSGKMIDIVFEGINFSKIIYIISDKYDEIMEIINKDVKKGATALYGKGSYTGKNRMIIMCVSKRRDIDKIKSISKQIDSNAFIIITDAREVYGLGFK